MDSQTPFLTSRATLFVEESSLNSESHATNEKLANHRLDTIPEGPPIGTLTLTTDEELILDFPVSISINELSSADGGRVFDTRASDIGKPSNSIDRNKKLCLSRSCKLTAEEEERVAKILSHEDDEIDNYILPMEEDSSRHTELDSLLNALGYIFDDDMTKENSARGDPILQQLAEERLLAEKEKSIDQALRTLLREPLPRVIRFQKNSITDDGVSLLSGYDSVLSMPISEDVIKNLVQEVKQMLEDDRLELASRESVRLLATSILNGEALKASLH